MKPRLVVTRTMPAPVAARIEAAFDPVFLDISGRFDPESLLDALDHAAAILVTPADRIEAGLIARIPVDVKILATFSVGTDHIDLVAARASGLAVVNTPDVLSFATAEAAMTLILMCARRTGEGERAVRSGQWPGWTPTYMLGTSLEGKTLGILGMGRIGQALARMAAGFSMRVIYHNRNRLAAAQEGPATYIADEADFLAACDVLSIHLPGGAATRHWLNPARLAKLRPGVIVVNTGRGSTIDDDALIAALKSGQVRAAGLDVFPAEPTIPPGYLDLEQVVLLPHLGSATEETRTAMGMLALDGIEAILAGQDPPNRVA
ncbi:2-hydroxyacid dehydrogenase [Acidiphilium acidophilum]|uniref:D-glycerate dehydrogenase n=1 Tax=Acidiphilium acidophilum TaxID=76588 RepID=A0AAW9DP11_ACIAO|nr:D-glycerate dehydrogenase [Acidiphilium acidophilum]MDX5930465.1 D-glycerate dehydrogenase [Acidiphilium acidophilum]GBQ15856.1 D-isomer specific 2-hydroxyacid dehydrogenase [Acidiphilium acidophilum DSM 700]